MFDDIDLTIGEVLPIGSSMGTVIPTEVPGCTGTDNCTCMSLCCFRETSCQTGA